MFTYHHVEDDDDDNNNNINNTWFTIHVILTCMHDSEDIILCLELWPVNEKKNATMTQMFSSFICGCFTASTQRQRKSLFDVVFFFGGGGWHWVF